MYRYVRAVVDKLAAPGAYRYRLKYCGNDLVVYPPTFPEPTVCCTAKR
eukprot:SAG31_NODE_1943_length_6856_cov_8.165458_1_plen_48_part_00